MNLQEIGGIVYALDTSGYREGPMIFYECGMISHFYIRQRIC
jgi:hypothetical protein